MMCQGGGKVKWCRRTGRQSAGVTKMGEKEIPLNEQKTDFFCPYQVLNYSSK
jgi:hypothetical protein